MFIVLMKKLSTHLFKKNIYLFGMLGLNCGTWDLSSLLPLAGSLVAVCKLSFFKFLAVLGLCCCAQAFHCGVFSYC